MTRTLKFCVSCLLAGAAIGVLCRSAVAQNAAQLAICAAHQETLRCAELVQEFYHDHKIQAPSPILNLDMPPKDAKAFGARVGPIAWRESAISQLKPQIDQATQEAMQAISTTAAVNQVGASSSAAGSTNLVAKPTLTDFLSVAAESGAFTDTVNGNSATLQANALGLLKYLNNRPVFGRWNAKAADWIQPLAFTAVLNIEQSSTTVTQIAGAANASTPAGITSVLIPQNNASLQSFGVSYALYRKVSPQDKTFVDEFRQALIASQSALDASASAIAKAADKLLKNKAFLTGYQANMQTALNAWHSAGSNAEKNDNFNDFVAAYASYDVAFANFVINTPDGIRNALDYVNSVNAFSDAAYAVFNQARGTPLATVNYLYSSPPDKPATHQFTLSFAELFHGGLPVLDASGNDTGKRDNTRTFATGAQLTGNFTITIYQSLPTGAAYGRLRDFQGSLEFDKPFGGTIQQPRGTFSFAGYEQYQYDPTVLNITEGNLLPGTNITLPSNAQVLLGTSGWLGVVQGKLAFNLTQGLTLPIAVKWSNRTELLQGNDVRGQFGLSYDLSALSKLVQPGK